MLKEYCQQKSLRKNASGVETGIMPLSAVKTVAVLIDVEDTSFDECKNAVMSFFRGYGIKVEIFFIDFRKLSDSERLITSITNTVLKKDLNWYGRPSMEKLGLLLDAAPDMLVSLVGAPSYAVEFLVRCSRARFKAGRGGSYFDLVFTDSPDSPFSELEAFRYFTGIVKKIV